MADAFFYENEKCKSRVLSVVGSLIAEFLQQLLSADFKPAELSVVDSVAPDSGEKCRATIQATASPFVTEQSEAGEPPPHSSTPAQLPPLRASY